MIAHVTTAQESVILQGKILNDTISKTSVNVVNISLRKGAITNDSGEFNISVRLNDTINVSAVQYESRQFIVSKTVFNRKKISLYLAPKITELDEVRISNIDLTGDLKKDLLNTQLKPVVQVALLGLPRNAHPTFTVEERRYYGATGGAGPLGSLINAISGRTKMLKKHLEVSQLKAKVYNTRDTFSDSLYMTELKIPEALIEDFIYYVFEDEKAIIQTEKESIFGLLDLLKEKSKAYLALKEQEK